MLAHLREAVVRIWPGLAGCDPQQILAGFELRLMMIDFFQCYSLQIFEPTVVNEQKFELSLKKKEKEKKLRKKKTKAEICLMSLL